jgi:hypothetical protein
MIEKQFEDYLDAEYPSIVNQFTKKSPLPPIVTLAIVLSLLYILHIVICWSRGEYEQLVNDWATPLGAFGGFYLFVVYIHLEKKVKNYSTILGQLTDLKKETYQNFYERFISLALRSRSLVLFYLGVSIFVNIVVIWMGLWYNSLLANFWLLIEVNVVIIGGALNLWLMICTSLMIYRIGEKPMRINPFHHDEAGGLRAFGVLSFSFFMLATIIATLIAIILFFAPWKNGISQYYGASLLIVVYGIVLISFFTPLLSAHKTLKSFKEDELSAINEALMRYQDELAKSSDADSYPITIKDKLEGALFVQNNVNKMKTWPFGYTTLTQVLGGTAIPLVSMLAKTGTPITVLLFLKNLF